MAIGFMHYPDFRADIADAALNIDPTLLKARGANTTIYQSKPWEPIKYTSIAGWLVLNYALLVLLITLFLLSTMALIGGLSL